MIRAMKDAEVCNVNRVADMMLSSAKTAPKGSGKDTVIGIAIDGEEKHRLADEMRRLAQEYSLDFFHRDGNNVDNSHMVVLLASRLTPFGLNHCGMCGFTDCLSMVKSGGRCVFNVTDLGIALGSAVEIASAHHVDNRIMYSAGRAAINLNLFSEKVEIAYGIPLYTGEKSIFFDRNKDDVLL